MSLLWFCFLGSLGASHVTITWEDNSDNETSFKIERAAEDLAFIQVATVAANVSVYTDRTVKPSTTYSYRVRASNGSGDSAYSNVMTVTAPSVTGEPPFISDLADVTLNEGRATGALGFIVNHGQIPAGNLVVTATSSNPSLVPSKAIVLGGSGPNRSIAILPAPNQSGTATITVRVSDGEMTVSESFVLNVNPTNGLPALSDIPNQVTATGVPVGPIEFRVAGVETSTGDWSLSGVSSNAALVPDENITFGGSGASRTVTVVPAAGRNGSVTITLSIAQGDVIARTSFALTVGAGSSRTFSNPAPIPIVDTTAGRPFSSAIMVAGVSGVVTDVTVQLHRLNHTWSGDVDALLVSPAGGKVLVMSDAGTGRTTDTTLTLSDSATLSLPETGALASGTYLPTNHDLHTDALPPPAPLPSYASTLAAFRGEPASGEWRIYVHDDMPGDGGSVRGGWSLTLTTVASGPAPPVIGSIASQTIPLNTPTSTLPFTISDADTPTSNITVSGASSNSSVVPNSNIVFGGNGSDRTVRVTPAAGRTGTSTITVTASDGMLTTVTSFVVTVTASSTSTAALPVVTSPSTTSTAVGLQFTYRITATNAPLSFDATNLPPGLTVNTNTGAITGTPTQSGDFEVTLAATNTIGTQLAKLALNISPPASPVNQTVTIHSPGDSLVIGQPVPLRATASSGLPVSFSVVSGNAVVNGDTLTIYDPRGVVIRGTQSGTADFSPASAELALSSTSSATGSLIYAGTGTDFVMAALNAQESIGTLYIMVSAPVEALVVPILIGSDGTFNATTSGAPTRTIRGRLQERTLTGTIEELGRTFSALALPPTGPTKLITGAYTSETLLSAFGTTHIVVSAEGLAYMLSINPTGITAGTGSVSPEGVFAIRTPQAVAIEGTINSTTKSLNGTIALPSQALPAELLGLSESISRRSQLTNLSSRAQIGGEGGAGSLISGIVVGGSTEKQMLLRAVGPGLAVFGIEDNLRNPRLQLFDGNGQIFAQNDNWGNLAAVAITSARVGAFKLAPESLDSALFTTVNPGAYTLEVGSSGGSGIALLEVYDVSDDPQSTSLVNLSTRGRVDTGDSAIIAGFVVTGNAPMRVLVRGIGPALEAFGVPGFLADPMLRIYQGSAMIAQNDNWSTAEPLTNSQLMASSADIVAVANRVGAFPARSGSLDAAIIITLAPGAYTAAVSGTNNTVGSGLLEIYQIPND